MTQFKFTDCETVSNFIFDNKENSDNISYLNAYNALMRIEKSLPKDTKTLQTKTKRKKEQIIQKIKSELNNIEHENQCIGQIHYNRRIQDMESFMITLMNKYSYSNRQLKKECKEFLTNKNKFEPAVYQENLIYILDKSLDDMINPENNLSYSMKIKKNRNCNTELWELERLMKTWQNILKEKEIEKDIALIIALCFFLILSIFLII